MQKYSQIKLATIFFSLFAFIMIIRNVEQETLNSNFDLQALSDLRCSGILGADGKLVTDEEREATESFISTLNEGQPDFGFNTLVDKQTIDQQKLINGIIQTTAIWLVLLVISFLAWFCYCSYCCCKCCPPCNSCKRDLSEKPFSKCELFYPVGFALLFALMIFSTAIAGLLYQKNVEDGVSALRCSLVVGLRDIAYETPSFPGIDGLRLRLVQFSNDVQAFIVGTKEVFDLEHTQTNGAKTTKYQLLDATKDMDTSDYVPFRYQNTFDSAEQSYLCSKNVPQFITGVSEELSGSLDESITEYLTEEEIIPEYSALDDYFTALIALIVQIENSVGPFLQGDTYTKSIDGGIKTSEDLIKQVSDVANTLDSNISTLEGVGQTLSMFSGIYFGVSLAVAILIIMGLVLVSLKKYKGRYLLHFGWCVYVIFMMIGFLLAAILNPVSVLMVQGCDYLNGFANDQIFFDNSQLISDKAVKDMIGECFFGGGDMFKSFNVQAQLDQLQEVTNSMDEFTQGIKNLEEEDKKEFINEVLTDVLQYFTDLEDGSLIDSDPSATPDGSDVQKVIKEFNAANDGTSINCIEIKLQPGSCPDGLDPSKADPSPFTKSCWHPTLLVATPDLSPLCAPQKNLNSLTNIQTWFKQQKVPWGKFRFQQDVVTTNGKNLNDKLWVYVGDIKTYVDSMSDFIKNSTNSQTGILSNLNCNVLKSFVNRIYDALCVLFVPSLFRMFVLLAVTAVSMFFGTLATLCTGLRFAKVSEYLQLNDNKVEPIQNEEQEMTVLNQSKAQMVQ